MPAVDTDDNEDPIVIPDEWNEVGWNKPKVDKTKVVFDPENGGGRKHKLRKDHAFDDVKMIKPIAFNMGFDEDGENNNMRAKQLKLDDSEEEDATLLNASKHKNDDKDSNDSAKKEA